MKKSHLWVANSQLTLKLKPSSNSSCCPLNKTKISLKDELKNKPKPLLSGGEESSTNSSCGDSYRDSTVSSKKFLIPNICWQNLHRKGNLASLYSIYELQSCSDKSEDLLSLPEDEFTEISKKIDEKILEILKEYNISPRKFASDIRLHCQNSKNTREHRRSASLQANIPCSEKSTSASTLFSQRSTSLQTETVKKQPRICLCGDVCPADVEKLIIPDKTTSVCSLLNPHGSIGLQTNTEYPNFNKCNQAKLCLCGDISCKISRGISPQKSQLKSCFTQCEKCCGTLDKEASTWETARSFSVDNTTSAPSFVEIQELTSLKDAECGSECCPDDTESSISSKNETHGMYSLKNGKLSGRKTFRKSYLESTDSLVSLFKMSITEADSEKILNEVDFSNCACPDNDSQESTPQCSINQESTPQCSTNMYRKKQENLDSTPRCSINRKQENYPFNLEGSFCPSYTSSPKKPKKPGRNCQNSFQDDSGTVYKDLPGIPRSSLCSDDSFLMTSLPCNPRNRNAGKTFVSRDDYVTICPEKENSQFYQFVYNDSYDQGLSRSNKSEQSLASCRRRNVRNERPRTWEFHPSCYTEVKDYNSFRPRSTSTPEGSFDEGGPEITYITIIRRWLFSEAIPEFLMEEFASGTICDSSLTHYTYILRGWLTVDIIRDMLIFIGTYIKKEYIVELNLRNCASVLKNWFQFAGLKTLINIIENPNFKVPQSRDYQKFIFQWLESPGMKNILNIAIRSGCNKNVHNTEVPCPKVPVPEPTYKKAPDTKLQTANCQSSGKTVDQNYRKYGNKSAPCSQNHPSGSYRSKIENKEINKKNKRKS